MGLADYLARGKQTAQSRLAQALAGMRDSTIGRPLSNDELSYTEGALNPLLKSMTARDMRVRPSELPDGLAGRYYPYAQIPTNTVDVDSRNDPGQMRDTIMHEGVHLAQYHNGIGKGMDEEQQAQMLEQFNSQVHDIQNAYASGRTAEVPALMQKLRPFANLYTQAVQRTRR